MNEAQRLRELIAIMVSTAEQIANSGDTDANRAAKYSRLMGITATECERIASVCECGETMVKLKTNWHCDGCGRSRKLDLTRTSSDE